MPEPLQILFFQKPKILFVIVMSRRVTKPQLQPAKSKNEQPQTIPDKQTNIMARKVLIRCETRDGLFRREVVAVIISTDGKRSFSADRDTIVHKGRQIFTPASVVGAEGKETRILLPSPSYETGSVWATVPETDLVPA